MLTLSSTGPVGATPLRGPLTTYDDVQGARDTCAAALAALPPEARRLDPGEAAWTAVLEGA